MSFRAFVLAAACAGLAACSDRPVTAPDATSAQPNTVGTSGASSTDTIPQLPAVFAVSGKVLGVSSSAAVAGSSDSLHFEPVAGARIKLYHNVLVNGTATQILAAETTSGADGAYRVTGLVGGYYIVQAAAPAGSAYADNFAYLAGTASEVKTDVYLWRKS